MPLPSPRRVIVMGLVGYSDSEDSSDDSPKAAEKPNPKPALTKPAFQKVIDRTNPHRIRVSLPESSKPDASDELGSEEPLSKRARTGAGGVGDFNALLPTPKRATATTTSSGRGRTLGSGVSLKTGATPGFSREPVSVTQVYPNADSAESYEPGKGIEVEDASNSSEHPSQDLSESKETRKPQKVGNAMMFKPLSVARKPPKKKKTDVPTASQSVHPTSMREKTSEQIAKPKVSLFSIGTADSSDLPTAKPNGEYEPLIHHVSEDATNRTASTAIDTATSPTPTPVHPQATEATSTPQSLSSIATDLNLSASARRQLFGRNGGKSSAINVVNFNTEAEYKANEELRAAGDQQAHNPVRAIAPGKHSLKQLVNAVSNQKEALEDHFASGKRNKKEAGSKYGW